MSFDGHESFFFKKNASTLFGLYCEHRLRIWVQSNDPDFWLKERHQTNNTTQYISHLKCNLRSKVPKKKMRIRVKQQGRHDRKSKTNFPQIDIPSLTAAQRLLFTCHMCQLIWRCRRLIVGCRNAKHSKLH